MDISYNHTRGRQAYGQEVLWGGLPLLEKAMIVGQRVLWLILYAGER